MNFANTLEKICIETVESGQMTKDLAILVSPDTKWMNTEDFLSCLDINLQKKLA
jgi:isocitrate dehydrogenase